MPTFSEAVGLGIGDGSTLPVYEPIGQIRRSHLLGKLSAVCCVLYVCQGHRNLRAPDRGTRAIPGWLPCAPLRQGAALSYRFTQFIVEAFSRRLSFPLNGENPDAIVCRGGSGMRPGLESLAAPPESEGVLSAEGTPAQLCAGKIDLDVVGPLRPPDIFQLHV